MPILTIRRAALGSAALTAVAWLVVAVAPASLAARSSAPLPAPGPAATPQPARPAAPGEADPGVRPTRLIDRDEIRVSRVELEPGAVRSVHVHDDVEYHVWTPVTGTLEISIGSDAAVAARPGQAFFMKRGTRHGFRNVGTTPAAVFEIFVKKSTASAGGALPADTVALLADGAR